MLNVYLVPGTTLGPRYPYQLISDAMNVMREEVPNAWRKYVRVVNLFGGSGKGLISWKKWNE